jgi:hypothetical protein
MAASRLRSRFAKHGDGTKNLGVETNVPRRLNIALKYVFRAEHLLRRLGLPLPLGGSQVVVATKPNSEPSMTAIPKLARS